MLQWLLWWSPVVGFPLTVMGGILGKNISENFNAPCRTKNIAREIPAVYWHQSSVVHMMVGGFLPFRYLIEVTCHVITSYHVQCNISRALLHFQYIVGSWSIYSVWNTVPGVCDSYQRHSVHISSPNLSSALLWRLQVVVEVCFLIWVSIYWNITLWRKCFLKIFMVVTVVAKLWWSFLYQWSTHRCHQEWTIQSV